MAVNLVTENKELKTLVRELQAENKARDIERKKLEEQITRLSNSKKSVAYSPCVKCQKLEQYIFELEKKIKGMELEKKEIQRMKHSSFFKSESHRDGEEENILLRGENRALIEKLDFVQKRVFILEDANRVLKEQILQKMRKYPSARTQPIQNVSMVSPFKVTIGNSRSFERREDSYIRRNLEEERWLNLQRKIKILEHENDEMKRRLWRK